MRKEVPVCDKYTLTIQEAAAYFNIGESQIRNIARENQAELVLMVGTTNLIKRKKMEEYIDRTMVL